tara:strand:+ start:11134 stop:11892 length:759 start_codon:yes stop_codon:yes gene_type:complete
MNKENTKVTIVPNKMGAKIRVSANNAEYAHVLLKQEKTIISTTGWVKPSRVHALLHGKLEDIQNIGIADTDTLPGQIVVKESLTPFNTNNPERDYKYAGTTGIVCCKHGEPIYRQCFYDPTMLETDELISHTNGDDIRIANTSDEDTKMALKAEQSFLKEYFPGDQVDLEDSIAEVEAEAEAEEDTVEDNIDALQDAQDKQLEDLDNTEEEEDETPREYEEENTIGASNPFDEVEDEELVEVEEEDDTTFDL